MGGWVGGVQGMVQRVGGEGAVVRAAVGAVAGGQAGNVCNKAAAADCS